MSSRTDDRGYNQMFSPSKAMDVRTERRCDYIISQISQSADSQHYTGGGSKSILEIGCGSGEMAALLASKTVAQVTGSDICKPFIEEAIAKHKASNLNFIVLDFNNPSTLAGEKFDYIVGNGILHHLYYHLDEALRHIKALLKPNGKIVFLEPNLYNPYCWLIFNTTASMRKWAKLEPDEMAIRRRQITKQLKNAGYVNVKAEYRDFLLPNIPAMLIKPVCAIGSIVEKIPILNRLAQSVFISADIAG